MVDNFVGALDSWSYVVGTQNVLTEESTLGSAEAATFPSRQRVRALLRPSNRDEVQECVKIANARKIPLYPVSSGKNWGFGSSVPVHDGCVILHLGRLNRIVDFDEELAYVTVEPGVTQRQLYEHLAHRKSNLWMDASASSVECSLIGNVMERGVGFTPYTDHVANVCGLEVVLPTGECVHTGFGQFPNAKATKVCRWGVGPYLDGLFTQSNLSIVTQMTIWLMPAPERFQACYFNIEEDSQLEALLGALHHLKLDGTIRSPVHIYNDYSVVTSIRQYPWEETDGMVPMPPDLMRNFRKRWDLGAWHGSVGLYGSRQHVAQTRRRVKQALKGRVRRLQFLDDRIIRLLPFIWKPYLWATGVNLAELMDVTLPGYGLLKGVPTERAIASTYWRKRGAPPLNMDPDRDECGLIWCAPVVPLGGSHARVVTEMAKVVLTEHDFEPIIGFNILTERCLYCMIAISYDRTTNGEDDRAIRCHDELLKRLTQAGYYPCRLGIQSMDILSSGEGEHRQLVRALKRALDPNNILAPGRYE